MANPERVRVKFEVKKLTAELATELGVDIQAVCEKALREEVKRAFRDANREAFESMNAWVEENGLPLEHLRLF